jgi:acetyl/propionyl-CoA carboxylase alpha subunit
MRVPTEYDSLLAKIVVWGSDRASAVARARRAVRESVIAGLPTSLPFHAHALADPDFIAGRYDTGFVAAHWPPVEPPALAGSARTAAALVAVLASRTRAAHGTNGAATVWQRTAREDALR